MVALIPLEHIFEFTVGNRRRKDSLIRANEFVRHLFKRLCMSSSLIRNLVFLAWKQFSMLDFKSFTLVAGVANSRFYSSNLSFSYSDIHYTRSPFVFPSPNLSALIFRNITNFERKHPLQTREKSAFH